MMSAPVWVQWSAAVSMVDFEGLFSNKDRSKRKTKQITCEIIARKKVKNTKENLVEFGD